jgi:LPXTG-site transpeptidase (sortase) family protein
MKKAKLGIYAIYLGVIFVALGCAMIFYIIHSQAVNASGIIKPPTYVNQSDAAVTDEITGEPARLSIPTLNINLPIIPGYYDAKTQTWTLTVNKVQYATITPQPNNIEGNTFLYGHARAAVFANLHNILPNSQAIIQTTNNHTFYYVLSSIRSTNPYDDSVFTYKGPPILTIQTCTGLFWQNRQFFTFTLEKAV